MKNILTTTLILFSTIGFTQGEYNYESTWLHSFNNSIIYNVPGVKNKSVSVVTKNVSNKKEWHYKKKYDANAKLVKYARIKDGKEKMISASTYSDSGKLLNDKQYRKNGKLKKELKIERNTEGKKLKSERFKSGNLKYTKRWTYRPEGCVAMSTTHKPSGELSYKWLYEYYSECDKKRSVLLKSNGKVKKEWTYDCKKEGEQLEKKKDVTQVCKWEEVDGKYLVKVYQSLNGKGKTYKKVSTYRSADTAIVKLENYNDKEQLTSVYTYDFSYKKPLHHSYYKRGKLRSETYYTYEDDKITSYEYRKKSKTAYKSIYIYGEDNLLSQMKSFKKGGELSRITEINYN